MQSTIVVLLYFCVAVTGGGDSDGWSMKLLNSFYQSEVSGSVPRGSGEVDIRFI